MARTDVIVLGAGIVGTSAALQLAKRGLAVALVDRRGPGEETSYGNTGILGGSGAFPVAFPDRISDLIRIAFKRAPEANYYLSFLPKVAPWLLAFRAATRPEKLIETARRRHPLMSRAGAEHELLMQESDAERYLRKDGWLTLFRTERGFEGIKPNLDLSAELGIPARVLDTAATLALEPSLRPTFARAVHWPDIGTVSNPLAVTRAYAKRFVSLGGLLLNGDARSLHRIDGRWRVDAEEGHVDAENVVVALGPWAPDVLEPLGIKLPLAIKRGYHRHFRPQGNAGLTRPLVDAENGYAVAPMEQGIRITTGAEFAPRDAPPTPVQLDRVVPHFKTLFPLGEPAEAQPWLGKRPCFADSLPVIGRAPGQPGLWLDYGHGHYGLTLGPITGRLLAEMITGATPFTDPAPFGPQRFN
jgi:D-amino-acid dehydrogenase